MRDIYHYLVKNTPDFINNSDEDLSDAANAYEIAAHAITRTISLLGNLMLHASLSEEYSDENARRDMLLMSHALCNLPRIAEAMEQNSHTAKFALKQRQGGSVK